MRIVNRWLEYLDRNKVRYSHSIHPRTETALETADAERVPAHEFAKTVVYFSERGFGMAVVAADMFVDLGKLGKLVGSPYVRLATEQELAELFPDCELGAMPPFGESPKLPIIVDAGVAGDFVAFTVGTHRDVVRMSFADFQRIASPSVAAFAVGDDVLV